MKPYETIYKEYFDETIAGLERSLTEQNHALARKVAEGFADVIEKLDVRGELDHLNLELQDLKGKLEQAFHVKLYKQTPTRTRGGDAPPAVEIRRRLG